MIKMIYSLPNDISNKEIDGVIYSHSTDGCGECNGKCKCKGCKYPLHKQLYRKLVIKC